MIDRARPVATGLPANSISSTLTTALDHGWTLCGAEPGSIADPSGLDEALEWVPAVVPGTVASGIGPDQLDGHENYDDRDWWYRCRLQGNPTATPTHLRFDGLATLAEVWLNGESILRTTNMFEVHDVDVSELIQPDNELVVVFRSLTQELAEKKPRPRWKTNLVDNQKLRWIRTTLLGRVPGWTPAIRPVGPWRPISMESHEIVHVRDLRLDARLSEGLGIVRVTAHGTGATPDLEVRGASIRVAGTESELQVDSGSGEWSLHGSAEVSDPELWWPHTHGEPSLHACELVLDTSAGPVTIEAGEVGFRSVEALTEDSAVRFVINGTPVFCRGACWTTNDIVSLVGDPDAMRDKLRLAARANANMLRVGGTMVYESDAFYRECDRLGIMVWQDFMFANMDYPATDPTFMASTETEVRQQISRIGRHPSVVAFCGGSEVEQQAAMFGATRDSWTNPLHGTRIPELLNEYHPGTPYWPSTPTGGVLPFHVGTGLAHYYGVGAYKRPLNDVRLAGVEFTPECLGFSNIPEATNLRLLGPHAATVPHHPAWKTGVPRDSSAGWDFEDIRDHYMALMYGVDPVALRSEDPARYLRIARVVTGRVMAGVYHEWRAPENRCSGGLVWFFNDLRPGAGWGIIDSDGNPKPAYYFLQRAWAPRGIFILDRGLDGARIDVHNEDTAPMEGELRVRVFGEASNVLAEAAQPLEVPGRGQASVSVEAMLDRFADPTYSYRFGPRPHLAIEARFAFDNDQALSTIYWPSLATAAAPAQVTGSIAEDGTGKVTASALAMDVRIELKSRTPSLNYVDLAPDEVKHFSSETRDESSRTRGIVEATNDAVGSRLQAEG